MSETLHYREWKDTTGLVELELGVKDGDDPWPAEVFVGLGFLDCDEFTLLADDARQLATDLIAYADLTDARNRELFQRPAPKLRRDTERRRA